MLGHLYDIPRLERGFITRRITPMAVHTAACILALCAGIALARPDSGVVALLRSEGAGGVLARRLLLPAAIVPIVLGYLRLEGQRAGWYGTEVGLALMVTSLIAVLLVLVWITARALDAADASAGPATRAPGWPRSVCRRWSTPRLTR